MEKWTGPINWTFFYEKTSKIVLSSNFCVKWSFHKYYTGQSDVLNIPQRDKSTPTKWSETHFCAFGMS